MSNEFFYLDDDGRKADAALHDAILDGGDDLASRTATAKRAIKRGMDVNVEAKLYAIPEGVTL